MEGRLEEKVWGEWVWTALRNRFSTSLAAKGRMKMGEGLNGM